MSNAAVRFWQGSAALSSPNCSPPLTTADVESRYGSTYLLITDTVTIASSDLALNCRDPSKRLCKIWSLARMRDGAWRRVVLLGREHKCGELLRYDKIWVVNDPAVGAAHEAAAVAEAALALSGHKLDAFTRELTAKMGRRELTGDQAVEAIIIRFAAATAPASGSDAPAPR